MLSGSGLKFLMTSSSLLQSIQCFHPVATITEVGSVGSCILKTISTAVADFDFGISPRGERLIPNTPICSFTNTGSTFRKQRKLQKCAVEEMDLTAFVSASKR